MIATITETPKPYMNINIIYSDIPESDYRIIECQWQKKGSSDTTYEDINGAKDENYIVKYTDTNYNLRAKIQYIDFEYPDDTQTIYTNAPVVVALPSISSVSIDCNTSLDNVKKGSKLFIKNITYSYTPYKDVGLLYYWYKADKNGSYYQLSYTTSDEYVISDNDYGCSFRCEVYAYNGATGNTMSNIIDIPDKKQFNTSILKERVKDPIFFMQCRIRFLNPDQTIQREITPDILDLSGSISNSFNNGARRTVSLRLYNKNNKYDIDVNKIWFGQMFSIELGTEIDGELYYYPQGVFYITNPSITKSPNSEYIEFSGNDKWCFLDGTIFGKLDATFKTYVTTMSSQGEQVKTNLYSAIRAVLNMNRGNGMPLDYIEPVLTNYYVGKYYYSSDTKEYYLYVPYESEVDCSKTYADVISEYVTMLAGICYYNAAGALTVEAAIEDMEDNYKETQWSFDRGNSEIVESKTTFGFNNVYNDIVVYGATTLGKTAMARVSNTNPESDTNIYVIGKKTQAYSDTNYYTDDQCAALAQYYLKKQTILQKSISLTCVPMYFLDVNKIIQIQLDNNNKYDRYLISNLTVPLNYSDNMQITATSVSDLDYTKWTVSYRDDMD